MDIKKELTLFKERIDPEIEKYLDEVIERAMREDVFLASLLEYIKTFVLAGGKRIRAFLMYQGYRLSGGGKENAVLQACTSIELVHAFFLVHDDIIDRDGMRHGVPTLHRRFAAAGKRHFPNRDHEHFGLSMAITAGDLLGALGSQRMFTAGFSAERIVRALQALQMIISRTILGEAKDVHMEYARKASEQEVLSMYENKTARYTIEGPLHLGAILAGGGEDVLGALSKYALPIGVAFQLQDDVLGMFGTSKETGKPIGADLQEGKMTLLVAYVLEQGSKTHINALKRLLGKYDLSEAEVRSAQDIFQESGALEYTRSFAERLIREGKDAIENIPSKNDHAREAMREVADYMIRRNT